MAFAFTNPEGYKKFKAKKANEDIMTSDTFKQDVMTRTGMTEEQYERLRNTNTDVDSGIEFPEDPFVI